MTNAYEEASAHLKKNLKRTMWREKFNIITIFLKQDIEKLETNVKYYSRWLVNILDSRSGQKLEL